MGVFSWLCSKCDKPILNNMIDDEYKKFSDVVAVLKNGSVVRGSYDGYGRIDNFDFSGATNHYDGTVEGIAKITHKACYGGEDYDRLRPAKSDPGQGHFYSSEELKELFGENDG